ncbi:MAG: hypothetical protein HFJ10_05735 [Lachnospiraceae bacterium]|nr:hypothetical protein [Lachnospiraceae bacterium]
MIKKYQILKESMNGLIQNSGLDIGAAYFILKDVFSEVEKIYFAQLNKECLEEAEKINSKTEENNIDKENDSYNE